MPVRGFLPFTMYVNSCFTRYDKSLPSYLRVFTAGAVYTRVLSQDVELLQKLRQYDQAVALLEGLIKQDVYHVSYRGHWYERLALNLNQHLKKHAQVFGTYSKSFSVV